MEKTKIKICGLTRLEDVDAVNQCIPDFAGFVFYKKSKRVVDAAKAQSLRDHMRKEIPCVGVFVNEDPKRIIELLKANIIQLAQLHGNETEEEIRRIKQATGLPVIKALQIRSGEEVKQWRNTQADYLLLDAGMGEGKTFDWGLIHQEIPKPFFLAGGLHQGNIKEAMETVKPYAVDLSSGVETNGKKDRKKIIEIVRSVRDE